MVDGSAVARLLRLSENEECVAEQRDAFEKVILNAPRSKGDARWTPLRSPGTPGAILIKALLQCHVIRSIAELSTTLELADFRNRQGAFSTADKTEITTRLIPLLYLAPQFAGERARWCGAGGLLVSPNDQGRLFDFTLRDADETVQAAMRRDAARQRAPTEFRTLLSAVIWNAGRATGHWGLARGILATPHARFLDLGTGVPFWTAVARCVLAQFISERTVEPAYARQDWGNARAIWTGPAEQDVEADMASALALLDIDQEHSARVDKDVYTPLVARLTALRELKAHHFGKPLALFTHLLSVLIGERARWVGDYALRALIAHTAADDIAQVNAAFGADPDAQLATAQLVWNYATRLSDEGNRDAFGQLWAALAQRVRCAPHAPASLQLTLCSGYVLQGWLGKFPEERREALSKWLDEVFTGVHQTSIDIGSLIARPPINADHERSRGLDDGRQFDARSFKEFLAHARDVRSSSSDGDATIPYFHGYLQGMLSRMLRGGAERAPTIARVLRDFAHRWSQVLAGEPPLITGRVEVLEEFVAYMEIPAIAWRSLLHIYRALARDAAADHVLWAEDQLLGAMLEETVRATLARAATAGQPPATVVATMIYGSPPLPRINRVWPEMADAREAGFLVFREQLTDAETAIERENGKRTWVRPPPPYPVPLTYGVGVVARDPGCHGRATGVLLSRRGDGAARSVSTHGCRARLGLR